MKNGSTDNSKCKKSWVGQPSTSTPNATFMKVRICCAFGGIWKTSCII